ncbi:protein NDRG3 isoform X3 [Ischnura elegans]|uniref:protein NDRG3 isoform X3 n=1 Tax=Ischnura elegans TaxID=197161 RepID=UPI001ED87845|nr:protein NDRG3 isoform X3 [Ischnura elegans]
MPSGLGTSYRSLADDVYRSTTVAENKFSVIDSVKKAFNFNGSPARRNDTVVLHTDVEQSDDPTAIITRDRKMPASASAEETALLGTMPSDSMDDIELKNIQLQFPTARTLSRDDTAVNEERLDTEKGSILVAVQGKRNKPAILTYHDLGLNYISNFQAFFNYIDMRALLENFCVYHVTAPGQEEGAPPLPEDYVYPSMDELADQLNIVMSYYNLKSVIGFGVGAGGNVLARFAMAHPEKVEAMCLVNCMSTQAGWIEWGYQKLNARHLRSKGMTQGVIDYLMWHHFGKATEERNHDLGLVYKEYFERYINPTNLALFIDSYIRRTDLNLIRGDVECLASGGQGARRDVACSRTLRMPVMNITGALSPHVDDTVTLNGRLDPTNSTWMKIQDCGMVLEEQPGKVSEAFRLFLQGLGYVLPLSRAKLSAYRQACSLEGLESISKSQAAEQHEPQIQHRSHNPPSALQVAPSSPLMVPVATPPSSSPQNRDETTHWPSTNIHITENPISEAAIC